MKEKVKEEQKETRKKSLKSIRKQTKGITLIALVITIIVLLILAGVSIAMLTGQNGILTQAQNAKNRTEEAQGEEENKLNEYNNIINNYVNGGTTASVQPGKTVEATVKNNYTDTEGNQATVPAGFVVSGIPEEQKISSGLVIYDIPENELESVDWEAQNEDGAYNVQTLYNQFVWIPVASEGEYERDFSYPSYYDEQLTYTPEGSTYTDTGYLPEGIQGTTDDAESNETAERNAVMKYNGFYIGRYEAGKDGTTVISKQNATVYANETQTNFKGIAKTMYTGNSENSVKSVKSAMCSGIQWDIIMKFVDGKYDGTGEKKFHVRTYDETRHTEIETSTGKNINDKVQNIYDLEGNCSEYVAEINTIRLKCVCRAGYVGKNSSNRASQRFSFSDTANDSHTFRPVLYIM